MNGRPLHLIKYEDLLTDAKLEVLNLSENFGWNIKERSIEEAVGLSEAGYMKNKKRSMQIITRNIP